MPFSYTVQRAATTNGTANTCSAHVRLLTAANQQNCYVTQIMCAVRNSTTVGSGILSVATLAGTGTAGGTSYTPNKQNPNNRAADTTAFTDATSFTAMPAVTRVFSIGFAQSGGQNTWVALERDNAMILLPNAGANGNLSLESFTATVSQSLDISAQFLEG